MQRPELTRRTVFAVMVIVAGLAVVAVALLRDSGSSTVTATASGSGEAIKPVKPLDQDYKDAGKPKENVDVKDVADPFAESYGASGRRKVTVNVFADGYVAIGLYYRDRKKPRVLATRTLSETRRVTGRFPLTAVVMQIPGSRQGVASRATCTITIDGTEVSRVSTSKPWALESCLG